MVGVSCAESLRESVTASDDRQGANGVQGNGEPSVHTGLIGSERSVDCEASKDVGVPGESVIMKSSGSLGEQKRESNEREWLPEFWDLKQDECNEQPGAGSGEETTHCALLRIVAKSRQLGGEIEGCTEDWKREQAHPDVCVFRTFEVQIHDDRAIESDRAEQSVLPLKMTRSEGAPKSREEQYNGSEGECGPIVREQSPRGGPCGQRAKIRMSCQQRMIGRFAEEFFPPRADAEGIEIEDDGAQSEEDTCTQGDVLACGAERDELAEVNTDKMRADKLAGEQAEATEDDLFHDEAGSEENLRANKPQDGHVVAGVVEWHGSEHQDRASHGKNDESFSAAFGDGQLGRAEFKGTNGKECQIGELRPDGLKLHAAEEQKHIQHRSGSRNVLFEIALDGADYIGNAKRQPIEEQHGQTGVVGLKGAAVCAIDAEKAVEPIEMIQVAGENAENFQLEPSHL